MNFFLIILCITAVVVLVLYIMAVRTADVKKSTVLRFATVYIAMVAVAIMIIYQVFYIQTKEHDKLVRLQRKVQTVPDTIKARRGNILSDDGSMMASSVPTYYLYMDMRVDAFKVKDKKNGKTFFENNVDSLAEALAGKFKDKSKAEYSKMLRKAYKQKRSEILLYDKTVSYTDLLEIKKFPILRRGAIQGGFSTKERMVRVNAFGILAKRTIGDIYGVQEMGGKSGLEMYYNKELKGEDGLKITARMAGRNTNIVMRPAVDGKDIVTTINLKLQECAERALMEELERTEAEYGCAVLMETSTGKIKAIANLKKSSNGYDEVTNIAAGSEIDPGSTFKTVSFLVAMDDGVIDTTTMVNTGDGTYRFANRVMKDWTVGHRPGFGVIDVPTVMYQSSNVGVSVLIDKYYGKNPQRFIDLIHATKIDSDVKLEIPGHAKVKIKNSDSKSWSGTSLPWMSIGYEVIVPPIYTLMFYNAIANGGRMMKPMFVSEIRGPLDSVKVIEPEVVNEQICKPSTLGKMQAILEGVVTKGTATAVKSDMFKIAGKTGTSQVFEHGKNTNAEGKRRHQITFCGYFPADNPMYSCIVYIREPKGAASAGGMCGKVFKTIAERAYILNGGEVPKWAMDNEESVISAELAMEQEQIIHSVDKDVVPDVVGLTAAESIYLLESLGFEVTIDGVGRVAEQSVAPGTDIEGVKKITLRLN